MGPCDPPSVFQEDTEGFCRIEQIQVSIETTEKVGWASVTSSANAKGVIHVTTSTADKSLTHPSAAPHAFEDDHEEGEGERGRVNIDLEGKSSALKCLGNRIFFHVGDDCGCVEKRESV